MQAGGERENRISGITWYTHCPWLQRLSSLYPSILPFPYINIGNTIDNWERGEGGTGYRERVSAPSLSFLMRWLYSCPCIRDASLREEWDVWTPEEEKLISHPFTNERITSRQRGVIIHACKFNGFILLPLSFWLITIIHLTRENRILGHLFLALSRLN